MKIKKLVCVKIKVDKKTGKKIQSNKYYNMTEQADGTFIAIYGRVGAKGKPEVHPMSEWDSKYKEKIKKKYRDYTDKLLEKVVATVDSSNQAFNEFYKHFAKYCRDVVQSTYIAKTCTVEQVEEAQLIINKIVNATSIDEINENLMDLYCLIPRVMSDVNNYLIKELKDKDTFIKVEQDALDSMSSSNIINTVNVIDELDISFRDVTDTEMQEIKDTILKSNSSRYKIHKAYAVVNKKSQALYDEWMKKQKNIQTKLLIHGTRNPNVFSILKQGLLIRPSNAAYISGAAYGEGVYHSAHTDKSLGYTGSDTDAIFFLQEVHMGTPYTYNGWYRDNKDISRSDMTYQGMQKLGCDSLYVKEGDGLQNSEYIVFNAAQTTIKYLVWLKK
jgi:poly [ADP-ribose] polymerase